MSKLAILGHGSVGKALAKRFAAVGGHQILIGSRSPAGKNGPEGVRITSVEEACRASDVLFLAVPAEVAVETLAGCEVDGKIVIDCTNPLKWLGRPVWDPPAAGSMAQALAEAFPGARVVKGFSTFGAAFHEDPDLCGEAVDVHLAGDDEAAKTEVADLARAAGFHPVDVGPLDNAGLLESLAILWIQLAGPGGVGRDFAFQIRRRG
ncbi:MAG: NAD(P)-binding domain-containing protein [Acidobacteria bacterium]|nr:NAD(P)-binding domain-containing protein [Acidobacteriota bacterium]